jgi:dehydration protein DpgD
VWPLAGGRAYAAAMPSTEDPPVLVEAEDHTLYITLNRPSVLNAQNQAMRAALVDALERLDDDNDLRVGVLTGAGGRAFSAGADLKEIRATTGPPRARLPVQERTQWIHFRRLERVRKPVIAAIDGYAFGGGLELALLCDIRVATEASTLALPEPRTVGGVAEVAVHRLSRMIPLGEALRLHLTASPMTADRAHTIGLVQYLVPDRQAMYEKVSAIAKDMMQCSADALRLVKLVSRRAPTMSIGESEAQLLELQTQSPSP